MSQAQLLATTVRIALDIGRASRWTVADEDFERVAPGGRYLEPEDIDAEFAPSYAALDALLHLAERAT